MAEERHADTDYAWAAGFLDGEGSFRLIRRQGKNLNAVTRQPYIGASQTVREPLDKLVEMFGGNVRLQRLQTDVRKTAWQWQINDATRVREAIIKLLPYLVVKHAQAEAILAYTQEMGMRGRIYTPEQILRRTAIIESYEAVA